MKQENATAKDWVLFCAAIICLAAIGGFAGGEIANQSFSIIGATIGGLGTIIVLLGLGAYYSAKDKAANNIPPEIREIFDRHITSKSNPSEEEILTAKRGYLKLNKRG